MVTRLRSDCGYIRQHISKPLSVSQVAKMPYTLDYINERINAIESTLQDMGMSPDTRHVILTELRFWRDCQRSEMLLQEMEADDPVDTTPRPRLLRANAMPPPLAPRQLFPDFRVAEVEDDWKCAICLEREGTSTVWAPMNCHMFHDSCITNWYLQNNTCPLCRR